MGSVILVLLLAGFIALVIVAVVKQRQERDRLLSEGKIIIREDGFWDNKESFNLSGVTIKDLYDKIESIGMTDFRIRSEYQPNEQRIVFNWNLGVYSSWTGVLAQTTSAEINVFELLIVSYSTNNSSKPDEGSINGLFTTVEKAILSFDPNVKITTEYVQRKTRKS